MQSINITEPAGVATMSTSFIPTRSTFKAWVVCLSASLFFFYEFVQMMMFNSITPNLMESFGVTATAVGKISAAYFVANIIFMFPAGILLDRFSTRRIIITAMLLCILGTVLFSFSTSIYFAMFCRFLTGIGGSFPFLCCLRLSSRWFPARRWALISGVMITVAFLGGAAGQAPMTFLTAHFGWRHALQLDALLGVLFTLLIMLNVFDYPANVRPTVQNKKPIRVREAVLSAVKNPQNWFYGLYTSMLNLPVMLLGAIWGGLYLVQVFHLTKADASLVTSMIFFGTIVGSPLMGFVSDKIGRRKLPMLLGALFSLLIMLLIMYSVHWSFGALLVLFFLLGLITSSQVISYPAISESNPHDLSGSALGLASVLIMGAPAIFQPLFGWLMDWRWGGLIDKGVPQYSLTNFHHGLLILPIACVVGVVMVLLARETYCQVQQHLQRSKEY